MSLVPGQLVPVVIQKPAAGGRMIARIDGQIVLVSNAIPGERLTARIERIGKGVAYAQTVTIDDASADRRDPFADPLCGGCLYAHITYARQLEIKAEVVVDALARIGRITLPGPVRVAASPEDGYRMRARLHVRGHRLGFFREGTHEVCDARATKQLLPATVDVLDRIAAILQPLGIDQVRELEVSENASASERVVHLDAASALNPDVLTAVAQVPGVSGLTASRAPASASSGAERELDGDPVPVVAGTPYVVDRFVVGSRTISLRRHVLTFFQGNRYLTGDLLTHVVERVGEGHAVLDLYAGAGLFSVGAAIARDARVTAVEGSRLAALDLEANAVAANGRVAAIHQPVEAFARSARSRPDTILLDPPRTGVSREALDGVIGLRAPAIIYVSCDVATLARDCRRLLDAGYVIRRVDGFDLFPNTPHVETVVELERADH